MWPKIWGLVFDVIKYGLAFVKTSDTKAVFNLDDLKWQNIQKNVTFSECLSKQHKDIKIAVL